MLESHKHTNHYFDLVPNFNQTRHEVLCAADYGTNKPCCRQPDAFIPEVNQCTALKPHCKDYITGKDRVIRNKVDGNRVTLNDTGKDYTVIHKNSGDRLSIVKVDNKYLLKKKYLLLMQIKKQ